MTEYTVHFQKGTRVGARSTRMVQIEAETAKEAATNARREFNSEHHDNNKYRLVRIDHFEGYNIVIDY
jgi:hypothetical protein